MISDPKIQIRNLYKVFGTDPKSALRFVKDGMDKDKLLAEHGHVLGLNDISVDMQVGDITVVMGLSGSGKSTLIRHINRLIEPTDGKILIDGEDALLLGTEKLREKRRSDMSMVFQKFALLPHRTVIDNSALSLEVRGVEREKRKREAAGWLERVGLGGYENHYPYQLSGGMQQRVGIARSLTSNSDIMLMDEAFSALDPLIRRQMQDEFLRIQSTLKKSIVFITHDFLEALRIADRMMIMRDGMVVQIGTPAELIINPADDYVAEFTSDVPLARVLLARDVIDDTATVQAGMFEVQETVCVEDLLCHLAIHRNGVAVAQNGNPIGVVTPTSVVCALSKGSEVKPDTTRQQEAG